MAETGETKLSMIHPDMFNRAIRRCKIEGIEVHDDPDGDTGLAVKIEDGAFIAGSLANLALAHDTVVGMVLDSNVGKLRQVVQDARALSPKPEDRDMVEDMIDTLDMVIANLGATVDEYREKGA